MFVDGFGSGGKAPSGDMKAIPAEAVLEIELELVSWKVVEEVTDDKKVMKKILTPGESYEKPNEGSTVKGICTCSVVTPLLHYVFTNEFQRAEFHICISHKLLGNTAVPFSYFVTVRMESDSCYSCAVKYVAKLENGTIFEKKGHDEELFQFVTDEGMSLRVKRFSPIF